MMDKLIVKGAGLADGEYSLDLIELANIGMPGSLTMREQHKVKLDANVLPADLVPAIRGLDPGVMVSLTSIILARHGKKANEELLWNARYVYGFNETPDLSRENLAVAFVISDRTLEDEQDPPASASTSSPNGGSSSEPTSENPESGPSRTGLHALPKSADSAPETLAS